MLIKNGKRRRLRKMTTIREEIENSIAKKWFDNDSLKNVTEEILKLFEKVIDEELKKWEVDDLQIIALKRVKKELRK